MGLAALGIADGDWGLASVAAVTVGVLALLLVAVLRALRRSGRAEKAMPLLAHIEELRQRLLRTGAALLAGTLVPLLVRIDWRGDIPVPRLAIYDTLAAQFFRAASGHLVPDGVALVVTSPVDGFVAQFTIALGLGIAVALPVGVYQLGMFLAPALQPRERRVLARTVLPVVLLFLAGAAVAYLLVLPITLAALYKFSAALDAQPLLRVADLATFTLAFMAGFGIAFQTPVVMVMLTRAGVVSAATWRRKFRIAVVAMLVAGMVLTPDPTILSQLMLAVPLTALYAVGAALAQRAERQDT